MPDYGMITYVIMWVINILISIYAYFDIKGIDDLDEKIVISLMSFTLPVIILLNFLGGIIGGIWLLMLGQLKFVLVGFMISLFFPWVYPFISMITLPFSFLAEFFNNKRKKYHLLFQDLLQCF